MRHNIVSLETSTLVSWTSMFKVEMMNESIHQNLFGRRDKEVYILPT